MQQVSRSALLPFTCEQMFDLVNDVLRYPEFLPWCEKAVLIENSDSVVVAALTLSKAGITQTFTTRNQLERPARIDLQLVDGPFSALDGHWQFHALGEDGCKVEMMLRFDFNSSLLNKTLGRVFSQAADTMVDAFCDRAGKVYG